MTMIDEPRLTDAAIAHRKDVEAMLAPLPPHPDDLFIHISGADVPDNVPVHVWLKFKAEVYAYIANKLKDLGT